MVAVEEGVLVNSAVAEALCVGVTVALGATEADGSAAVVAAAGVATTNVTGGAAF
jgi:hypothetical protein